MTDRGPVIGIDLGTTNSVVAVVQDGVPRVNPGRTGQLLTPSVVAVARNGRRLVGALARRQAITNAANTVYAAKRLIGRRWGSREVEDARWVLPYRLVAGPDGNDVRIEIGGRVLTVQEIAAVILAELRGDAEAWLAKPLSRAVITVPAYFNDGQPPATQDAGRISGPEGAPHHQTRPPSSAVLPLDSLKLFELPGGGCFHPPRASPFKVPRGSINPGVNFSQR